jgi:cell division protein ZapA (FtsZ GTPase activity inhibitor)
MERRQNITVSIEGIQLPLTVKTEEEEKIYRDAASMIQDKLQKLRDLYPTLPNEKYYYAMVMLNTAADAVRASNRANMGPVLDIINDLNKDIEAITAKK